MSTEYLINGIAIIGDDLFEVDAKGNFINTIATIFPEYRLMVVARCGIHADQIEPATEYLHQSCPLKMKSNLFRELCDSLIRLNFSKNKIVIRMELPKIESALVADEMLQKLLPKNRIQFTGLHLREVRSALRLRGEIWRIAPAPIEEKDFSNLICHCRYNVGSGIKYLYNKHTGEHLLTYREFIKIRPLIRKDKVKAVQRLKEIVHLHDLAKNQGHTEIAFFLPENRNLEISLLKKLLSTVENAPAPDDTQKAEDLFDQFANLFAAEVGPDLMTDNPKNSQWRETALRRLYNIDKKTTAEWALGLGPEFYLNIQWLPGVRIIENIFEFDSDANPMARSLINYYRQIRNDFISVNVGCIISPMAQRDSMGEEREVYIVALGLPCDRKEIRHVRMSKWGVKHRLNKGESIEQAINETKEYRDYIIDRLRAVRALSLPIPVFKEINVEDEVGIGIIPVYYFEREYVPGIVTSRIPVEFYSRKDFLPRLAGLLGAAAAACLVVGRKDPRSYQLYFDDGDEVIQLNGDGLPERMMMIETTGSFADWTTPLSKMLPHCLEHLSDHIEKARQQSIDEEEILKSIDAFTDGLITEIQRMQRLLNEPISVVTSLFSDRTNEPMGIRNRWEGILNRLQTTDVNELKGIIENEFSEKY